MADPITPEAFAQLLDSYDSAVRLSAIEAAAERRQKLLDAYTGRQLQDGEFRIEGVLFGAWMESRGKMLPHIYRNPENIPHFFGELVSKMLTGIGQIIDQVASRRRDLHRN